MTLPVGPRAVAPDVYQAILDSIAPNASRLKASYNGYLARALAVAVAVHLLGLGAYWAASALAVPDFGPAGKRVQFFDVIPPPSPPVRPDAPQGSGTPPPRIGTGLVTPVSDADADSAVVVAENDDVTAGPSDEISTGGPTGGPGPGPPVDSNDEPGGTAEPYQPGIDTRPPPVPEPIVEPVVRDFAEIQPTLIGGIERLQSGIEYPQFERSAGVDGRVVVQFVVDEAGVPSQIVVARSVSPGLDAAAMQAVREARFTPGRQNGQAVRVRFTLPVTFRLR